MSEPIGSVIVGNQRSSDERTDSGKGKDASSDVASLAKLGAKALQREMGTRVQRAAEDREGPIKRKKTSAETETAAKRLRLGSTIIAGGADARNGYMPKTRETKLAWEELLNNLQALLADDEQQALRECAEEALDVLRDTKKRDIDKKPLVERILDLRVSDEFFHKILTLSRRLTDYTSPEDKKDVDMIDIGAEEEGVAVVFEDEESEGEYEENAAAGVGAGEAKGKGASDEMVIEDDEDEDGVETRADVGLQSAKKDEEDDEAEAQDYVDAKEIDAHWIQRTMGKLSDNEEAHETQRRAEQVLAILADETKTDVESALMQLFQWQLFDFIKLCIKNRWKIVWCTKMTRAKGEARFELASALKIKEYGPSILEELERETKKSDAENRAFRQQLRQQQAQGAGFEDKTKNLLDLKELTFEHEGHTMSNTTCELPRGSQTEMKKGYKTIYVPAYKKRVANAASLVSIKSLPEWTHPAFAKMTTLNAMQSKAFPCAFERDDHMLLCAPTAAGKTNVAMLAVLHEVSKCVRDGQIDEELLDDVKVVYIAPMKALVQEVVSNFGARLAPFQMKVSELTGDSSMTRAEIAASHMIVTTPEKWDIVTRKAGEKTHMQQVKLLIIDEIHLLHDARGPILEAIIARTIRHIEVTQEYTRLLGLSATLPNYEDVATILRVQKSADPSKNGLFYFDSSYRPVPLQQQYIGVTEKKPMKRRGVMNDIVYEKIMAQAGKNQVIVFVHSRKDTVVTAKMVRDKALENEMLGRFFSEDAAKKELLVSESESVQDPGLRNLLPFGFGVHHAGLVRKDRQTVEDLFSQGFLQVLVSTATLAWGVNLPAHTVIIKGTQIYNPEKGKWTELSSMDVLQMIGRAGRPQFDTQGEGIIITGQAELQFYLSLLNQQLPIESQFVSKIVDQLNAEVVMGSVQNTREASQWLKYTYLYVRMRANPSLYGISDEEIQDDRKLEQRRADLIHTAALQLDRASLVKYDRKSGLLEATDLGRVCSYYYLTCGTISKFNELLKPTMHELDVFRLFAMADEFKQISVREEEKMELTRLLERVPIPVREGVDDPLAKVNVLLQTHISQLTLDGYALMADMVYVTQSATRIVRAMFEIVVKKGWAQLAELLLNVAKQVERRIWLSHSPLRQMKGIPLETIDRLEKKNFSWDRYYNLSPSDLATLIDNPAAAKKIHRYIHMLPRLELDATAQPITRSLLRIELVITPDFHYEPRIHGSSEPFLIFVEDPDGERLLHVEPFVLKEQYSREEQLVYFYVPMFEPMPPQYFIKVISERWLWSETVLPISFRQLILPEKTHAHTELLDLKLLPIAALGTKEYADLYPFKEYNSIQTQVFHSLFKNNDNVLICAPTGSGKTLCAEVALFRLFEESKGARARAVYVAPTQDIVDNTYSDWKEKFGDKLGKAVVMLTGETVHDLKLLEAGDIIVSTAQYWDQLSRKWQKRKNVTSVALFIVDELHMLNSVQGPTLEIVVSRMRYISSQLKDHKIRIVALSHSLLHARDVGLWLGTNLQTSTFNFHSTARPVPLEMHFRTFDQNGFTSRQLAMYKPTFLAIRQHSRDKPAVVFTPSKRITIDMVVELVTLCKGDINPAQFIHCNTELIEKYVGKIKDKLLQKSMQYGIGFFYEGMAEVDRMLVTRLFDNGLIQIVVMPYTLCYQVRVSGHMVVIAGTQYYNGAEHRHADYNLADLFQMMSKAGRPLVDQQSVCMVMCHTPKKESLKKMLYEPCPVESMLDMAIADHFNAEIVSRSIESKQDAVDYLTWTYLYRRLRQNPNFYKMYGVSHEHISEYLSELTETSIKYLEQAGCITVEERRDEDGQVQEVVEAANLGMIAAYYYVEYTTIEKFASSITEDRTNVKKLIEIVAAASEFADVPIRHREEEKLQKLARHCTIKRQNLEFHDPHTKVHLLLHAHFSRKVFSEDLMVDLQNLLPRMLPLVSAMVDVVGSNRWLSLLLATMELSQMVVQGMWNTDSVLLQLPYFTPALAKQCADADVSTIFDLLQMEDDDRNNLLKLNPRQMSSVAAVCNAYPSIEVTPQIDAADDLHESADMRITVNIEREIDDNEPIPKVHAPLYPKPKEESWWVVVGEKQTNYVHAVKKVIVQRKQTVKLDFPAPNKGTHHLLLYFMCDCYMGVDQEIPIEIKVGEALPSDSEDGSEEED